MLRRLFVVGVTFISVSFVAGATDSVVLAHPLSNHAVDDGFDCPPDLICMRFPYLWKVKVIRTLSGPPVTGTIRATAMQHMTARIDQRKKYLFVLSPVADAQELDNGLAPFRIKEIAWPEEMFCLTTPPKQLGIDVDEVAIAEHADKKYFCFEAPEEDED
jgi:hypothetical protein